MTETSRGSRPAKSNSHLSVVLATNLQLRLESQRESHIVLRYVLPELFFARALINSLRSSQCLYCHRRLQRLPTPHIPPLPRLPEPFQSDIEFSLTKVNSYESIKLLSHNIGKMTPVFQQLYRGLDMLVKRWLQSLQAKYNHLACPALIVAFYQLC
jgi:hypothetical protein